MNKPRIAFFGGDRSIAKDVLAWLFWQDASVEVVAGFDVDYRKNIDHFVNYVVLPEDSTSEPAAIRYLREADLDYIICVHFPHYIPKKVLDIPKKGVINLHPAYLPYNRGWHTPSWAILEGTPIGATMQFMDEGIDTGPIIARQEVKPSPGDTAHTLYQKVLDAEFELFKEVWPLLLSGDLEAKPQPEDGTAHKASELESVQRIDMDEMTIAGDVIDHLRALTTSDVSEAAYFVEDGKRYRVRVEITEG